MKAQRNVKKCEVSERDAIQLLSLEKEPDKVEYIDEILIEGFDRPENEIQLIEQMEIIKEEKPENEIQQNEEFMILKKRKRTFGNRIFGLLNYIGRSKMENSK